MRLLHYLGSVLLILALLSPLQGRRTDQPQSEKMVAIKKELEDRKKSRISYPDDAFDSEANTELEAAMPASPFSTLPPWLLGSLLAAAVIAGAGLIMRRNQQAPPSSFAPLDPEQWVEDNLNTLQQITTPLFGSELPEHYFQLEQAFSQALNTLSQQGPLPENLDLQIATTAEGMCLEVQSQTGPEGQQVGQALARSLAELEGASLSIRFEDAEKMAFQFFVPVMPLAVDSPEDKPAGPDHIETTPPAPTSAAPTLCVADQEFADRLEAIALARLGDPDFNAEAFREEMAMSKTQFYRRVQQVQNLSPGQYLRKLRLGQAMEMLEQGNYNVSEIAYEVGFNNLSYFAKCFKKEFGRLPSEVQG